MKRLDLDKTCLSSHPTAGGRSRRSASGRRGMSLLETLIAVAVLGVGSAALMDMLTNVSKANRSASFHVAAINFNNSLLAQIQDAACDTTPTQAAVGGAATDPAFQQGIGTYVSAPTGAVTMVGDMPQFDPPIRAQYQITAVNPEVTVALTGIVLQPASIELQIELCQYTSNEALADGTICTLNAPFRTSLSTKIFQAVKICNIREEELGRGEMY